MLEKVKKNIRDFSKDVINNEILNKENLLKNIIKNIKILSTILYITAIYSLKVIYTFFLENYYGIPAEYFKLNFRDNFLWGIAVFIIFSSGAYLIFLLPFGKKLEENEKKNR